MLSVLGDQALLKKKKGGVYSLIECREWSGAFDVYNSRVTHTHCLPPAPLAWLNLPTIHPIAKTIVVINKFCFLGIDRIDIAMILHKQEHPEKEDR
ncbi:hypothetical protein WN944_009337 [Citrus x changshan-huyou]|uniref:Uncharacterized protein n=1 Tax=Citrus x changshan-huyou TaxID=2935761 RepID=A0AAP0MPK1_9ROSI